MKDCPLFDSLLPLLVNRVGLFFCALLLFSFSASSANERNSKDELIESIHQRVRDLNSKMRAMGASNLPSVEASYDSRSSQGKNSYEEPESNFSRFDKSRKKPTSSKRNSSIEPNTGFYFVPFGGIALANDIDWSVAGTVATIETKAGHSLGASIGYRWKYFYLEERISYSQAQLERFHYAGATTSISGEISNLSFQQSIGLNFNFNEWSGVQIGFGGGITKSELSYSAGVMSYEEDDWVFSYDGTIGIFFQPTGYFRGGINYRWLRTENLERFSGTDIHLIELALGLQF